MKTENDNRLRQVEMKAERDSKTLYLKLLKTSRVEMTMKSLLVTAYYYHASSSYCILLLECDKYKKHK